MATADAAEAEAEAEAEEGPMTDAAMAIQILKILIFPAIAAENEDMYSPTVTVRNRTMVKPLEVAATKVAEGVEESLEVTTEISEEIKGRKKRLSSMLQKRCRSQRLFSCLQ